MIDVTSTFEAHVYHPSLGNEVVTGRIVIDRWQFHFQSEAVNFDIPLGRLRIRESDGDDERVYFRDINAPDWEVFTTDMSVLDHPYVESGTSYAREQQEVAANAELWRRVRIMGYVLGGFVLVVWLGQIAASTMARILVARVPASVEQSIGDEALTEIQQEGVLIQESNRIARLEALAEPLTGTVKIGTNRLSFYILDAEYPNAFAMGGGHVVVTVGLMKMLDTPEELLGVIAHEVAHVTEKHLLRKAVAAAGPMAVFRVYFGDGDVVKLAEKSSVDLMVQQSFSQGYEIEADEVGFEMLVAANIDPRGEIEALKKLRVYEAAESADYSGTHAFDSHPALEKRIARLEKKWRKLKKKDGFLDLSASRSDMRKAAGN
jgi:beta-barrel assembly-enhancing protease